MGVINWIGSPSCILSSSFIYELLFSQESLHHSQRGGIASITNAQANPLTDETGPDDY